LVCVSDYYKIVSVCLRLRYHLSTFSR
jgi:hypothetical protein